MARPLRLLGAAAAFVVLSPALAAAEPHTRTGLCAGFGFGLESVSWTDARDERSVEASGVLSARVAWALKPTLAVGIEFWGWAKDDDILLSSGAVPVTVQLSATTLAATFYPGADGFFIRLGAGLAYGRVDVDGSGAVEEPDGETGVAVLLAPGYEFRVTDHFALGAQGDLVYLGLSAPVENPFGYGLNVQFNWYW